MPKKSSEIVTDTKVDFIISALENSRVTFIKIILLSEKMSLDDLSEYIYTQIHNLLPDWYQPSRPVTVDEAFNIAVHFTSLINLTKANA